MLGHVNASIDETRPYPEGALLSRYGRTLLSPLYFQPKVDSAMGAVLPAPTSTSATDQQARAKVLGDCPADPVSLMRTEIAPLCQESYLASGQEAPFTKSSITDGLVQASALDTSRRVPQLIVRNAKGQPLAGKYCQVIDAGTGAPFGGLLDHSKFLMEYTCGPSDANGLITLQVPLHA